MRTFDNEEYLFEIYRLIRSAEVKYCGKFFNCLRIELLTKNRLFSKSWVNSSKKDSLPPDFHNNKHHLMMEFMRIDDCINEINGKHISNTFEKTNTIMKKFFYKNFKNQVNGDLIFIPDTNNSNEFTYIGYLNNFKRVINQHSAKVDNYRKNYPLCKDVVFFIVDESNSYMQVSNEDELTNNNVVQFNKIKIHYFFQDKSFIDIIKECKADYVIWMGMRKDIYINEKLVKYPHICIYDIKHLKHNGIEYKHNLMVKIKEEL